MQEGEIGDMYVRRLTEANLAVELPIGTFDLDLDLVTPTAGSFAIDVSQIAINPGLPTDTQPYLDTGDEWPTAGFVLHEFGPDHGTFSHEDILLYSDTGWAIYRDTTTTSIPSGEIVHLISLTAANNSRSGVIGTPISAYLGSGGLTVDEILQTIERDLVEVLSLIHI